jgi:hypothetical protein
MLLLLWSFLMYFLGASNHNDLAAAAAAVVLGTFSPTPFSSFLQLRWWPLARKRGLDRRLAD